jgi:hypothetical protein
MRLQPLVRHVPVNRAALQSYLAGRDTASIRRSAADAYAKNQRIKQKAALGVFSPL